MRMTMNKAATCRSCRDCIVIEVTMTNARSTAITAMPHALTQHDELITSRRREHRALDCSAFGQIDHSDRAPVETLQVKPLSQNSATELLTV